MSKSTIVFVCLGAGVVASSLTLMHLLQVPNIYTTSVEVGLAVAISIMSLILFFQSSESRLKRRSIATMFGVATLTTVKVTTSQGIDLLGRLGVDVPFGNKNLGKANGILKVVVQSDWRVDIALVLLAGWLFWLGRQLFVGNQTTMSDHDWNQGETRPIVAWDKLQTTRGCKEYLIDEIESEDQNETMMMRQLLRACLLEKTHSINNYVCNHAIGKRKAQALALKSMARFKAEFDHLFELHGNLLKSLRRIREDYEGLGNLNIGG